MDELLRKLRAVEAGLPASIWLDESFVGIRVDEYGETLFVTVLPGSSSVKVELSRNTAFDEILTQEGLALQVVEELPPGPQRIRAGTPGYGRGLRGYGTLGWFIYLDGTLVCVSNHHVLCADVDSVPLGTPIYSGFYPTGTRLGVLHGIDPIRTASPRLYDFAIGAIDDPSLVAAEMAACADSTRLAYPVRLGSTSDIATGNVYVTVGARAPICAEGRFRGLSSTRVGPYADGKFYHFSEQLLFDPISARGDSGSIVVEKQTNRVIGLIFAGTEGTRSLANPIYRKGWTYRGTRALGELDVPEFVTEDNSTPMSSDFPDFGSPTLPDIFSAGRPLKGGMPYDQWINRLSNASVTIVRPHGNWLQIKADVSPGGIGGGRGRALFGWVHVPSGIVYME